MIFAFPEPLHGWQNRRQVPPVPRQYLQFFTTTTSWRDCLRFQFMMNQIILDARNRREQDMKRRFHVRVAGHRQPFNYDPSTGRWVLTWEDRRYSGISKTLHDARDAVRRAVGRLRRLAELKREILAELPAVGEDHCPAGGDGAVVDVADMIDLLPGVSQFFHRRDGHPAGTGVEAVLPGQP
jgi:hypothetical protein